MEKLRLIINELKAPKGQHNDYSNFMYRSATDIIQALKPHLEEHKCLLRINDELVQLGERVYIKATITLTNAEGQTEKTNGWARESDNVKGQGQAQTTGAASSYAHKFGLQNLFLLDDGSLDPDNMDNRKQTDSMDKQIQEAHQAPTPKKKPAAKPMQANEKKTYVDEPNRQWLDEDTTEWKNVLAYIDTDVNPDVNAISSKFKLNRRVRDKLNNLLVKRHLGQ